MVDGALTILLIGVIIFGVRELGLQKCGKCEKLALCIVI